MKIWLSVVTAMVTVAVIVVINKTNDRKQVVYVAQLRTCHKTCGHGEKKKTRRHSSKEWHVASGIVLGSQLRVAVIALAAPKPFFSFVPN